MCVLLRAFVLWILAVGIFLPVRAADGRAIYKKHCAECHGKAGEGVKGKHDEPLHGNKNLERLTRYIDKYMPEDHPERLDAKESERVAKYIYDAFYSDEARLKKNPPRVELVHLTNRQYANTVADLVGAFVDGERKIGSELGLRGTYYDSRNFNGNKKLYDRVDHGINFDFGSDGPEKTTTNEFSIQWRGSLVPDQTGVYDIIVKTPNGMRFWLNDDDNPVIDAWVASGELTEHRVSMRLIGGRPYPLRLDCFRFKDKTNSISLQWKPPHGPQQVIPGHNLRTQRVAPTFVINTAFPADDSSIGYERGVAVSKEWDEATTRAALEVAAYVTKNLDRLADTKASDTNRTANIQAFAAKFVQTAFRRPLTPEQKRVHVDEQFKKAPKTEEAVKRIVLLALKSPQFLYLGLEPRVDDYEIASRISYGLMDSSPDAELLKAAEQGSLHSPDQVRVQAKRLLADNRTHAKVYYFLEKWLDLERGDDLSKDPKLFPGFTPEMAADLRTSLKLFLDEEVWNDKSDYRRLLLSDYMFVNDRLAKFYELKADTTNDFVKVKLDPKERSGVITHPFILSALAYAKQSSPIHRGVFLTRKIVGRTLKPPPIAVAFNDAEFDPSLTMREKVAQLTKGENCMGCHSAINPLGFSLEHFDAVGKYRTADNGKSIDAVAEYLSEDGKTVKVTGPRDVAEFAATNEDAHRAFIQQLFHHVVKQPVLAYGSTIMDQLRQSFAASGFNIQQLLVDIVTVSALHDSSLKGKNT
ncbi:MAG TPA: DUF1592 domain-containing protein [Verrucomicrobiae bacterium]|nr:DUF1592 domain-containing protein [Verrucomicrobiae bacterium]